MTVARGTD